MFLNVVACRGGDSEPGEAAVESTVRSTPTADMLAKTLLSVASDALVIRPSICARLLLLSHHPSVVEGRRKDVVWKVGFSC